MTAAEKEYGDALFELAAEEQLEDRLLEDLDTVRDAFAQNSAYAGLVLNPALKKEARLGLLEETFGKAVHSYVLNLCKILCEKSALSLLNGCAAEYRERLYAARGILPVTAITAMPLSEAQKTALEQKLAQKTGKTILLTNRIDAAVLGGVKLLYGGLELDGSVAGRLDALRAVLMQS